MAMIGQRTYTKRRPSLAVKHKPDSAINIDRKQSRKTIIVPNWEMGVPRSAIRRQANKNESSPAQPSKDGYYIYNQPCSEAGGGFHQSIGFKNWIWIQIRIIMKNDRNWIRIRIQHNNSIMDSDLIQIYADSDSIQAKNSL